MVLSIVCSAPANAQEQKGDVAFSYSLLHDSEMDQTFPAGWSVAANGNLNSIFGIVGEVGGHYKSIDVFDSDLTLSLHTFMGGVRLRKEATGVVPFAQLLLGAARIGASYEGEGDHVTEFALQPGGGVDFRLTESFGIRVQGDYRMVGDDEDERTNEFRFAVGAVLGFGR